MWFVVGKRAKRVRHYQGCTNFSWCGICLHIYIFRTQRDKIRQFDWSVM